MKWREVKDKVEETVDNAEELTDETIDELKKKAKKAGKKFKNLDDLIKNFGSKKLKEFSNIVKDIKEKNTEPKTVKDVRGHIVPIKPKKETPAQIRKRIKKTWKDVPDVSMKERLLYGSPLQGYEKAIKKKLK